MARHKCERCSRKACRDEERFCRTHRAKEMKAMRDSNYLTHVPRRPYITPDMDDPFPALMSLDKEQEANVGDLIRENERVGELAGSL